MLVEARLARGAGGPAITLNKKETKRVSLAQAHPYGYQRHTSGLLCSSQRMGANLQTVDELVPKFWL